MHGLEGRRERNSERTGQSTAWHSSDEQETCRATGRVKTQRRVCGMEVCLDAGRRLAITIERTRECHGKIALRRSSHAPDPCELTRLHGRYHPFPLQDISALLGAPPRWWRPSRRRDQAHFTRQRERADQRYKGHHCFLRGMKRVACINQPLHIRQWTTGQWRMPLASRYACSC